MNRLLLKIKRMYRSESQAHMRARIKRSIREDYKQVIAEKMFDTEQAPIYRDWL